MTQVYAGSDFVGFIILLIVIGVFNAIKRMASTTGNTQRPPPVPRASPQNELEQFLKSIGAQDGAPPALPPQGSAQQPRAAPQAAARPPPVPKQRPAVTRHSLPLRWEDTAIVRAVTSRLAGKQKANQPAKPAVASSRQRIKNREQAAEAAQPSDMHAAEMASRGAGEHVFALPPLPSFATMPMMSVIDLHYDSSRIASHEDGGGDQTQATTVFVMPDLNNAPTLRGAVLAREVLSQPVALRRPVASFPVGPIS